GGEGSSYLRDTSSGRTRPPMPPRAEPDTEAEPEAGAGDGEDSSDD
ncbi:hypothetical protein HRW15_33485, partial [Streptomyces lunaelactis]|nr:hypothetical protein [Streptomyces lunaelactis]